MPELQLKPLRKQAIGITTYIEGRYFNTGSHAIAIMATVTEGIDWAAYIGATDSEGWQEEDTMTYVVRRGNKLDEKDARYFFPDIKLPYRP